MGVALVAGGARGIGKATAIALAQAGYEVVITYLRSDQEAEQTVDEIRKLGYFATALSLDVTDSKAVTAIFDTLDRTVGFPSVVIANAGATADSLVYSMTDQQFTTPLSVGLIGTFFLFRTAILGMRRQRWGRLIAVTSMAATWGRRGAANYAASKAGIHGLVRSLAKEVGRGGITVNAVAPGVIETGAPSDIAFRRLKGNIDQIAVRRLGKPEEVAAVIRFLASRDSSYVTGVVLPVDGGLAP